MRMDSFTGQAFLALVEAKCECRCQYCVAGFVQGISQAIDCGEFTGLQKTMQNQYRICIIIPLQISCLCNSAVPLFQVQRFSSKAAGNIKRILAKIRRFKLSIVSTRKFPIQVCIGRDCQIFSKNAVYRFPGFLFMEKQAENVYSVRLF